MFDTDADLHLMLIKLLCMWTYCDVASSLLPFWGGFVTGPGSWQAGLYSQCVSDVIGMSDRSSASESRCLRNSVDAPSAGKASMSLESESKKAHIYIKKSYISSFARWLQGSVFFYPCFSFTLDCVPSPLAKIWISRAQGWAGCHMTSAGSHRDVLSRSPRTLFFWHTHMWFRQDWMRKGVGGQTNKQHPDVKTQRWSWLDKSETVYIS